MGGFWRRCGRIVWATIGGVGDLATADSAIRRRIWRRFGYLWILRQRFWRRQFGDSAIFARQKTPHDFGDNFANLPITSFPLAKKLASPNAFCVIICDMQNKTAKWQSDLRRYLSSFLLVELCRGLALTFRHMFRRKITVQFPKKKPHAADDSRLTRPAPIPQRRRTMYRLQTLRSRLPRARHPHRIRTTRRRLPPHHQI